MKKLEHITVRFTEDIQAWEIPAFRGAIVDRIGRENDHFHNHNNITQGFHNRYPLVQYKRSRGKPVLFALGDGTSSLQEVFALKDRSMRMGGREFSLKVEDLRMQHTVVGVWSQWFSYRLRNWLALNQENYRLYQQLEGLADRYAMLERVLTGNIVAFGRGIGAPFEEEVVVKITQVDSWHRSKLKSVTLMGFNVEFKCNVSLPQGAGLGKSVSLGHGTIHRLRPRRKGGNDGTA